MLPAGVIERIDYDARKVHVNLTEDQIHEAPDYRAEREREEAYRQDIGRLATNVAHGQLPGLAGAIWTSSTRARAPRNPPAKMAASSRQSSLGMAPHCTGSTVARWLAHGDREPAGPSGWTTTTGAFDTYCPSMPGRSATPP